MFRENPQKYNSLWGPGRVYNKGNLLQLFSLVINLIIGSGCPDLRCLILWSGASSLDGFEEKKGEGRLF